MKKTLLILFVALSTGLALWIWGPGRAPHPPILLLGIDGFDWKIIDRLVAEGRMPHLQRLRERGASGPLLTLDDIPLSPVIWTSIATGKLPAKHGITWFMVDTPDGGRTPVRSHNRQVKALWNILAEKERRAGVVGWWATAPAERIGDGVVASDALGYHGFGSIGLGLADEEKVYPPELFDDLGLLIPPLQQIDFTYGSRHFNLTAEEYDRAMFHPSRSPRPNPINPIHLFQEYTATTLGYTSIAKTLLEERNFDLLAVYFESPDSISHLFMKYAPPRLPWIGEKDFERFKNVVDSYYCFIDEQIGEVLKETSEDWAVFIVSDHGFRSGENRPKSVATVDIKGAHLDHEPEGIFIACGPGIRQGSTFTGGRVLDVAPTLLHYMRLQVATDMDGKVLLDIFEPEFMSEHPIRYVSTYESPQGWPPPRTPRAVSAEPDFEVENAMRQLQTIGYLAGGAGGGAPEPDEAEETEDAPTSPEQLNNMGRIHLRNGELDEALKQFEKVLELDPRNADAHANIGLVHRMRGRIPAAMLSFRRALEANPNSVPTILQLAELSQAQGDLPRAQQMYQLAIDIDGRLPGPYVGLGDVLERQGRHEDARRVLTIAAQLDPRNFEAHYNLGVVNARLGNLDAAREANSKALEIRPEHPLTLNNLGHIASQLGESAAAQEYFRRAAQADPRHAESRYNLATLLLNQGKLDAAIESFEEAIEINPGLELAYANLGLAFLRKGDLEGARKRFEVMVRFFPERPEGWLHLARIAVREEQEERAIGLLRRAHALLGDQLERILAEDPAFRDVDPKAVLEAR